MAAVENISMAEARSRVESGWISFPSPNGSPASTNPNNFPSLPRDSRTPSFENNNRFNILGEMGSYNENRSYADVTKSQQRPRLPRNPQTFFREEVSHTSPPSFANPSSSQTRPRQQGYDVSAHRQALYWEANGRPDFDHSNGVAFSRGLPPAAPSWYSR
ncbi:hypothetical protein ALC62_09847 [Cyphomyrmex costatus]|uniref:Uncharacterized protein n=1 Tax=Cyphomyrmex costatus TaxID=456900 RepID=A0A151K2D2_9HYME|nr:hypothetical protein ALC62_09847 [Cyphomyrmex costatus]